MGNGRGRHSRLLLLFSSSVVSDSLQPYGLQHARLPCPSLSPRVGSNSCPLSQWCHSTILCCPFLLLPSVFPSITVFSSESALCIRWPKYWIFTFSISPSHKYSRFQVAGGISRKHTYETCLGWLYDKWVSTPALQNLKSLSSCINCTSVKKIIMLSLRNSEGKFIWRPQ